MNTEACLMIGGPKDGQIIHAKLPLQDVLHINIWPEMNAYFPTEDYESGSGHQRNIDYAVYRRFPIRDAGKEYFVYYHDKIHVLAVMPMLLQGYKPIGSVPNGDTNHGA